MKPKVNQRKEADQTRSRILKAATKLFAQKGFAATPTALIAKTAKVNEALIFHHFGNKTELWKKVKEDISLHSQVGPIDPEPQTVEAFLQEAIEQRLNLYAQCPELHRIKQWQRLEDQSGKLLAENPLAPNNWIPAIQYLQQRGQIDVTLDPKLMTIWLTTSINAVLFDELKMFHDPLIRNNYIKMIVAGLARALQHPLPINKSADVAATLCDLINRVYEVGEAGLWHSQARAAQILQR